MADIRAHIGIVLALGHNLKCRGYAMYSITRTMSRDHFIALLGSRSLVLGNAALAVTFQTADAVLLAAHAE